MPTGATSELLIPTPVTRLKPSFLSGPQQPMANSFRALILCGILFAAGGVNAQQMFEWGFTGDGGESTSLPVCANLTLEVDARSANGTPPYYMMAFAVDGTPTTSFIGTNESNLFWTVTQPVGSQLVLGVVDSKGNSGGIDTPMYTVVEGSTTDCLPATSSESSFTITANVTDDLTTCEPWGLTVQGGTPPYIVTIAPMNSGNVTNNTFRATDTVLTWINRAEPNSQLIAAASDATGRWAKGTPFVHTTGSSDTDCVGLATTTHSGSAGTAPSQHHSTSRRRIGIIVGACVAGLLVISGLILAILFRRRFMRQRQTMQEIDPFFNPPQAIPRAVSSGPPSFIAGSKHRAMRSETESSLYGSPSAGSVIPLPVINDQQTPNLPPPPPYPKMRNDKR